MRNLILALSLILNAGLVAYVVGRSLDRKDVTSPDFIQVTDEMKDVRLVKFGDIYSLFDKAGRISAMTRDDVGGIVVGVSNSNSSVAEMRYAWIDSDQDGLFDQIIDHSGEKHVVHIVDIEKMDKVNLGEGE